MSVCVCVYIYIYIYMCVCVYICSNCTEHRRNVTESVKPKYSDKNLVQGLCPSQNWHGLGWDRTLAFTVRSRRLTTWSMSQMPETKELTWTHRLLRDFPLSYLRFRIRVMLLAVLCYWLCYVTGCVTLLAVQCYWLCYVTGYVMLLAV